MSAWESSARAELKRLGIDDAGAFAHLAKAAHVRRPSDTWRSVVREMLRAEALEPMLRAFTPVGGKRPTSNDARAVFGAIWAAPEMASSGLFDVLCELVPWCHKELGTSHQAASVGAMALGVWPEDARAVLEKFRDDPTLRSLLPTLKASLRKQKERHGISPQR